MPSTSEYDIPKLNETLSWMLKAEAIKYKIKLNKLNASKKFRVFIDKLYQQSNK